MKYIPVAKEPSQRAASVPPPAFLNHPQPRPFPGPAVWKIWPPLHPFPRWVRPKWLKRMTPPQVSSAAWRLRPPWPWALAYSSFFWIIRACIRNGLRPLPPTAMTSLFSAGLWCSWLFCSRWWACLSAKPRDKGIEAGKLEFRSWKL